MDASSKVDVVVLEENHVEQADAVVASATNLHGHLFEDTHAGSGLAGIEHTGAGAFHLLHIAGSHGSNATHALHDVEHEAFGLEQGLNLSFYHHSHIAGLHRGAVFDKHFHLHFGVEAVEHHLGNFDAGQNAFFLDEEF